jgi:hypothetical protein
LKPATRSDIGFALRGIALKAAPRKEAPRGAEGACMMSDHGEFQSDIR